MKIVYTSYTKYRSIIRTKKGIINQSKVAIATLEAALKEFKNNPNCTAVTIRLEKEVK